jgi:hypothetical protein
VRAAVAQCSLVRVLEQLELGLAADERGADVDVPLVDRAEDAPGAHRRSHALELERSGVLDEQPASRETVSGGPDEDLARHRHLLEARRQVHRFSGGERRVPLVDDDLAGLDAHPYFEVQLADGLSHAERRPGGALGVVLMRLRDAERREHGVPRELLDDASVHGDAVRDTVEELRDAPANNLWIGPGHELRRVDDVDEQDGRKLSLYVGGCRRHAVSVRTSSSG